MDGIIPLWKERGMTSHDCVFKLRKILKTKKVGHSGTLDPDVDGVLPICIGKGTKVIQYLQDSGKTYIGEITLGFSTTTEDVSGDVVMQTPVTQLLPVAEIDQVMKELTGTITQIPPMYSAVKVNGKRLYEYAREGLEVERPKRQAEIYQFKRTSEPVLTADKKTLSWKFEVKCGKGTYVRTLAVDTGLKLGFAAHMSHLTRTESGGFRVNGCLTLEQVANLMEKDDLSFLQPIERAVSMFERLDVSDELYQNTLKNGGFLTISDFDLADEEQVIAIFHRERLISLYQKHPTKPLYLKPIRVLRND